MRDCSGARNVGPQQVSQELLGVPGVCLISEAHRRPPNDAGQELRLQQVARAIPQAPLDLAKELLIHQLLDHAQVVVVAGEGQV
eukprot:15340599-Alexandrium_andersonii.AAC.1